MFFVRNSYRCEPCGVSLEDLWDSSCNDRCPNCRQETCPEDSEDLSPDCEEAASITPASLGSRTALA